MFLLTTDQISRQWLNLKLCIIKDSKLDAFKDSKLDACGRPLFANPVTAHIQYNMQQCYA